MLENQLHWKADAELPLDLGHEAHRVQRVPPHVEEARSPRDLVDVQNRLPDAGQSFLGAGAEGVGRGNSASIVTVRDSGGTIETTHKAAGTEPFLW